MLLKSAYIRLLRLSGRRAVILMAAVFLLLLAAGDSVLLWLQYDQVVDDNTRDAANLTVVLEQQVRQDLELVDGILLNLIHVGSVAPNPAAPGSPYAFAFRPTALIEELRLYDRNGRLRNSAGPVGPEAKDWSRARPFLYHKGLPDSALRIGDPFEEDGTWRYPLSRRISGANGAFNGIAVVLVDMGALARFFRLIDVGTHGSIAIIRRDGLVIARYPPISSSLGASVAKSPIFRTQIAPLAEGMVRGVSVLDGYERIGHFRSVSGLPLIVVVFMDKKDVLAPWWSLVELHAAILGAVAMAVVLLVIFIARQQAILARATAAVLDEQTRLEAITAHLPAALFRRVQDPDGRVHYPFVSIGSDLVLDLPRDKFIENPSALFDRSPQSDRMRLESALRRSAETLTNLGEEFSVAGASGEERWWSVSARPRRLEDGTVVWDGLLMDVSAPKAALAATRTLERRLEAIVDKVPGVVFQRVREPDGRIHYTFLSPAAQSLFGVPSAEVLRDYRNLRMRIAPDDQADFEESFALPEADPGEWNREFRVIGPNGQHRWVRGMATCHRANTSETVWDGIFLDITSQKAAVAATWALQNRIEAVVANTPGVVFECLQTAEGLRFSFLSPQVEQMFGVSLHEALHNFDRIKADIVPEDRPALDAKLLQHGEDLADWVEEFRVQLPGQPLRWIRGTARARRIDAAEIVWNGVFQDITQAKAAEEQAQRAQRNEALVHLTAGVAHEFNNLLTVIQGNLELIEAGQGSPSKLAGATLKAAERGARVIRALQAYARRQSLRPRTGRIGDLLQEVIVLLHSILGSSVKLTLLFPGETWPIHVDWDQLGNTLIALAVKAKEAMPRGGTLAIETANTTLSESQGEAPRGDYVRLMVSDSGEGMAEDMRRHAFDPFYSANVVGGGSDLGLSAVFGFVKQSNGYISLNSREGKGTTVVILLPRAVAPAPSPAQGTALA